MLSKNGLNERLFPGRDLEEEWHSNLGTADFFAVSYVEHVDVNQQLLQIFYENYKERVHSIFEDEIIDYAFRVRYCAPKDYWPFVVHLPSDEAVAVQKELDETRGISWDEHQRSLSVKRRIRSMYLLNEDYDPIVDERNYTKLPEGLRGTYIEELLGQFKSKPCRTRFVKLDPGEEVSAHQDYNPKYALKAHIPVYSNPSCRFGFPHATVYIDPPGAYLLNTGLKHSAHNDGDSERVHLIVSLDGQRDVCSTPA